VIWDRHSSSDWVCWRDVKLEVPAHHTSARQEPISGQEPHLPIFGRVIAHMQHAYDCYDIFLKLKHFSP
jgi:hypothetical protein